MVDKMALLCYIAYVIGSGSCLSNYRSMADRVNKTNMAQPRRETAGTLFGIVWCACAASETGVSRQEGFVNMKGGKTLLFVEYHE